MGTVKEYRKKTGRLKKKKKKELIPFATAWMELESITLSEISQTVRESASLMKWKNTCFGVN